jgi:hypothetical protein
MVDSKMSKEEVDDIMVRSRASTKEFMNRRGLQHHFVQRKCAYSFNDETGGMEELELKTQLMGYGKLCLADNAAKMYSAEYCKPEDRRSSFNIWLGAEMKNYRLELEGKAVQPETKKRLDTIFSLMGGDGAEEDNTLNSDDRSWALSQWVSAGTRKEIQGVTLRVRPVKLTDVEILSIHIAKTKIEEHVNTVDPASQIVGPFTYGKGLRVNPLKRSKANSEADATYDLDLVNIKPSASNLIERLEGIESKPVKERPKAITGLFYGAPGTGKTALAKEIARTLGKELVVKAYSEIQSKYVGEGEKNLAAIFVEAAGPDKILLLDEIDSIASNRMMQEKSHDKTMTNQLLTCVDDFEGTIFVTTNFIQTLDPAVLRRFFLKTQFGFLTTEQSAKALKLFFPRKYRGKVLPESLRFLTPGDFKAIHERCLYEPKVPDFNRLVEMFQEEQALKIKAMPELQAMTKRSIGFH